MAIQYTIPLKIIKDEDTGLLLLVDSTGKTISRGALPTIVNNLGLQKGVKSSDLPPPVDPRETTPPQPAAATNTTPAADTATSSVQSQSSVQEQPLSAGEQARLKTNQNAVQESITDSGNEFGNSPKVSVSQAVLDAQAASRTDSSQFQNKIEVGIDNKQPVKVGRNPLEQFASYTYSISLHMLSKADFNQMGRDPDSSWVPSKTLIAGAGKWGVEGFTRDSNFLDDFYFDNFKMTTIIGSTAGNQGTNAVELSFTLIEPYGVTLLDRLIDACLDPAVDGKNYLEIPYLIQIDFYGYDDEGNAQALIKQRKYIPINILSMNIKASIRGAEYQMSAVPYAHAGFQESIAATPANFEIVAKDLEEFFQDTADANDLKTAEKDNQRQESEKKAQTQAQNNSPGANTNTRGTDKSNSSASGTDNSNPTYVVKSYVSAYNAWGQATVSNKNATDYNKIKVVIDQEILKNNGGKIINPKVQPTDKVPQKSSKSKKEVSQVVRANYKKPDANPILEAGKFSVNGQTSIMSVINNIMLSSEYIRSQMIDTSKNAEQNAEASKTGSVKWWKIIPDVKLRTYCTQNAKWYLDVTYYVVPYTVYNRTHPNVPKDMPKGWHREYNYIYTGQNNDIIDFSIEFDTAFYTAVNIDRTRVTATQVQATKDLSDKEYLEQSGQVSNDELKRRAIGGGIQPVTTRPVADNQNVAHSAQNRKDGPSMAAASVAEHQMSGASADQLNVRLKIIGDPQFIKQDEIYYSPAARRYSEVEGQQNNFVTDEASSISMDGGEVHVKLSWKTPVDIDEETGTLRINGNYFQSAFSGIFQVLLIENTFAQGKFEQTLDCIRLPDQPTDVSNQGKQTNDIRQDQLPVATKNAGPTTFTAEDSQSVEQQKTSVLTKLLENKTTNTSVENNSNLQRVDTSPEVDSTGYGQEYQNSQARALSNVNRSAPTQTASDFFTI